MSSVLLIDCSQALTDQLKPLTYTKSILDIRIGRFLQGKRILRDFSSLVDEGHTLWINAFVVLTRSLVSEIHDLPSGSGFFVGEHLLAVKGDQSLKTLYEQNNPLKLAQDMGYDLREIKADLIEHTWDLLKANKLLLPEDLSVDSSHSTMPENVTVHGDSTRVHVEKNVRFIGSVSLNTESGPIYIAENSVIKAPTIIEGPCYIGADCLISAAQIRPYTSIGSVCKIGGEVSATVFEGFSNKAHTGYVGDSYISKWVNLGAMSTTSNLKNNYGLIRVYEQGAFVNTEEMYIGSIISDCVTLGIGTMIATGTVIGPCVNFWGGQMDAKYYPPFIWGQPGNFMTYDVQKSCANFSTMMKRREQILSEKTKRIWVALEQETLSEREIFFKEQNV